MPDLNVCPADHKHGLNGTCYVGHKCRCENCRAGNRARTAARNRAKLYGRYEAPRLVDAAPARAHVKLLSQYGMGWKQVATVAGVSVTGVNTLMYGRSEAGRRGKMPALIHKDKAAKILAVRPNIHVLAGGALVPARGTHRRVQALVRQGWTQSKLAKRLGINGSNFTRMMNADSVTARVHLAAVNLFAQLWDQVPPHTEHHDFIAYTRATNYAKAHRWLSPLAWDDIDLDDEPAVTEPDDTADETAIALAIAGERVRLTPEERRIAIRELHAAHLSDIAIAKRLHCADRTVLRIRKHELKLPANIAA
jgi:transcriptional regulator with XRE-family HTH domain